MGDRVPTGADDDKVRAVLVGGQLQLDRRVAGAHLEPPGSAGPVERPCGPLGGQPLQLLPIAAQTMVTPNGDGATAGSCRTKTAVTLASKSTASPPAILAASALASDPSTPTTICL